MPMSNVLYPANGSGFNATNALMPSSRREFLQRLAVGGLMAGTGLLPRWSFGADASQSWQVEIGVCQSSSQWELIHSAGCAYVEDSVSKLLNPKLTDAEFEQVASGVKAKRIPIRSCNGFLPSDLKLVGPDPRHDEVVEYAAKALQRARILGISIVVLGSGGARKVPDGFDRAKAQEQFCQVLKRLAAPAEASGVTVAMESLNRGETNFGNTVKECLGYIKIVNHPRICLTADMYHMLREEEAPDVLLEAGSKVVHCHLAEKAQRTPPGTAGDDFKPYLRALKKLGYHGGISLECKWKKLGDQLPPAVAALKKQIDAVSAEG